MRIKWTFNWNLFKQSTVFGPDNMKSADMNVQTGQLTRRFNGEIHVVNHNLFSNIRLPQNRNDLNSERTWYTYFSRGLLGVDWVRIRFKNYKAYKCFQFPLNNNFCIYKLHNIKAIKPVWKKSRIKNKRYACLIEPCAIFRKKFFGKESTTLKLLSKKKTLWEVSAGNFKVLKFLWKIVQKIVSSKNNLRKSELYFKKRYKITSDKRATWKVTLIFQTNEIWKYFFWIETGVQPRITKKLKIENIPSRIGERAIYSSVASSARSP